MGGGGGGIYCTDNSTAIIVKNIISENSVGMGSAGGGICVSNASPVINGNTIIRNTTWGTGGGISCSGSSQAIIQDNIISQNFSGYGLPVTTDGGGIACDEGSSPFIINNMITGNTAVNSNGGGISCCNSFPTIIGCTIANNTGGSSIYCYGDSSTININYNNIFGNENYGILNANSVVVVNAEHNWWGDLTGPFHPVYNPVGKGDTISNYVNFEPWLTHYVGFDKTVRPIIPIHTLLSQNYPNPFNPTTTIKFDLPNTSEVTLKVFNILGEEIATLVSDRLSAGTYSYEWDASNLASGVYLCRLQSGDYVETRKMVLMR